MEPNVDSIDGEIVETMNDIPPEMSEKNLMDTKPRNPAVYTKVIQTRVLAL